METKEAIRKLQRPEEGWTADRDKGTDGEQGNEGRRERGKEVNGNERKKK